MYNSPITGFVFIITFCTWFVCHLAIKIISLSLSLSLSLSDICCNMASLGHNDTKPISTSESRKLKSENYRYQLINREIFSEKQVSLSSQNMIIYLSSEKSTSKLLNSNIIDIELHPYQILTKSRSKISHEISNLNIFLVSIVGWQCFSTCLGDPISKYQFFTHKLKPLKCHKIKWDVTCHFENNCLVKISMTK